MSSVLIGGRYQVIKPLRLAPPSVYIAWDIIRGSEVVIKTIEPDVIPYLRQRCFTLCQMRHPNLVQLLDLVYDGNFYQVETHAGGEDFLSWANHDRTPVRLVMAAAAILRGLHYLHSNGLVHGALTPRHVRVEDGLVGELPAVRLINWGRTTADHLRTEQFLRYCAPEFLAQEPYTPAADIYSFGVILLEGLYGRSSDLPSYPYSNEAMIPESERQTSLGELLFYMLHSNPELRPSISSIFETLSLIANRPLQVSLAEFKRDYLPYPVFVGRKEARQDIEQILQQVEQGRAVGLHLTGVGKSTMVRQCCLLGGLSCFQIISTNNPISLLSAYPHRNNDPTLIDQLAIQLADMLIAHTRQRPLLLNLDGCQPQDSLAQALIAQLSLAISAGEASRLLILWTGDLPAELQEHWYQLSLPSITPEQLMDMAQNMLYLVPRPSWMAELYNVTGGDPRLTVEIIRAQIEAGLPDTLQLPSDRMSLSAYRLTTLSPAERRLLAIISHAVHSLPYRMLRAVVPEHITALPSLLQKGFLLADDRGISPANIFLRHAAQAEIDGPALIQLHQRYCTIWQSEENPDALALGHHLLWSGQVQEGVKQLLQSAAAPVNDLEHALKQLPARDSLRSTILQYLAKLARARGDVSQALTTADTLERENLNAGSLLRAEILLDSGYATQALQALSKVQTSSARQHLLAARAYVFAGDYEQVIQEAQNGRNAPDCDLLHLAQLDNLVGLGFIYSGKIESGLTALNQAEATARALNHRETIARVQNSRGIAFQLEGRFEDAAKAYEEALNLANELGDLRFAASIILNLGTESHRRLELSHALEAFRRANMLATRSRAGTTRAAALANEANLLLMVGELAEARSCLAQAETVAKAAGAVSRLGFIYLYKAELEILSHNRKQAELNLQAARDSFGILEKFGRVYADLAEGEMYFKAKEAQPIARLLAKLQQDIAWESPDRWRFHLLAGKAALIEPPSRVSQAVHQLELALSLSRLAEAKERDWEILALLAHAYKELGRQNEALFFVSCFRHAIEEITPRIPFPYRAKFCQRSDVQYALQLVDSIADTSDRFYLSAQDLQRILSINKELNRQLPLEELWQHILQHMIYLTEAERGLVLLTLAADSPLEIAASANVDEQAINEGIKVFSTKLAQTAIAQDRPIVAADVMDDERFQATLNSTGFQLRAVLCVPLRIRDQIAGALYVDHPYKVNAFQPKHIRLMEAFADQAGIALETARLLHDEMKKGIALAEAKEKIEIAHHQLEGQMARQAQELDEVSWRLRTQEEELVRRFRQAHIVGRSPAMKHLYLQLDRIAEADLPVFILGESGTGKELIARAIHYTSPRRAAPLVAINCAAIPLSLMESELFGHRKGSFTGAVRDRAGLFEVAGEGTLFLDEIGELPLDMQPKLLRVLQEGTFRRVGDEDERRCYCRVIAANNQPLEDIIAKGKFREDLFYRLNVLPVTVPPLRQRREDIPLLVEHILNQASKPTKVSATAMAALLTFDWPGNIRQLENELLRAAVLSEGIIEPKHLSISTAPVEIPTTPQPPHRKAVHQAADDFERQVIEAALAEANNNVSLAAQRLNMNRTALHRRIRKLGIVRKK